MSTPDQRAFLAYSAALDEIYRLRMALAYEARVTEAHLLLKSFPKSRRDIAETQVSRMREAARGVTTSHRGCRVPPSHLDTHNIPQLLTRHQWEHREQPPQHLRTERLNGAT